MVGEIAVLVGRSLETNQLKLGYGETGESRRWN